MPRRSGERGRTSSVFLLVALLLAAAHAGLPPLSVSVRPVRPSRWQANVRVLARVRSNDAVTLTAPLASNVAGNIVGKVLGPYRPAGFVRKGRVLLRIVPVGLGAQIAAARAEVVYAQKMFDRYDRLLGKGLVARAAVDKRALALAQARGELRTLAAEASVQTLLAPFSGTVRYLVPPGTVVTAGEPVAALRGRGRIWAVTLVPPGTAARLRAGDPAFFRAGRWRGAGKIRDVGNRANRDGLVRVYLDLPPDAHTLLPGQWLRARLLTRTRRGFAIPLASVVAREGRTLVFVVHRLRAVAVPVRILGVRGRTAWVRGPLEPGEEIVVQGAGRLTPGDSVTPRPP